MENGDSPPHQKEAMTQWLTKFTDTIHKIHKNFDERLRVIGMQGNHGRSADLEILQLGASDAHRDTRSKRLLDWAAERIEQYTSENALKKFGFEVVNTTDSGYELLVLSFDGTVPQFMQSALQSKIELQELTIDYDVQCPYVGQSIETVRWYCEEQSVPLSLVPVDTLQHAKNLACVFNHWAIFCKGTFQTVNLLLDVEKLKRIVKK